MQTDSLVAVDTFCENHNIEVSFIRSLQQTGLLEITTIEHTGFIEVEKLPLVEKYIRFYYDLDINLEGIETIVHMLERIAFMQNEMIDLRNKLRLYEAFTQ